MTSKASDDTTSFAGDLVRTEADANRWRYVRDVLWKGKNREDLPKPLFPHFYAHVERPSAAALDRAVDALIERTPSRPMNW